MINHHWQSEAQELIERHRERRRSQSRWFLALSIIVLVGLAASDLFGWGFP